MILLTRSFTTATLAEFVISPTHMTVFHFTDYFIIKQVKKILYVRCSGFIKRQHNEDKTSCCWCVSKYIQNIYKKNQRDAAWQYVYL